MNTELKDGSDINLDKVIAVTLDDLSEDERWKVERALEEEHLERLKLMLTRYEKTRDGVVKKVTPPSPSPAVDTKVSEEIAHLVDLSVASKYGSGVTNMTHVITQSVASTIDEFKESFSKDIDVTLNNNQGGRVYASSSANNFVPSVANPIVWTSDPQNYSSNNWSVGFNYNLQQPSYDTVAFNTPPLLPVGTGVPYGPVPDSYFNGSPQQTTHAQTVGLRGRKQ